MIFKLTEVLLLIKNIQLLDTTHYNPPLLIYDSVPLASDVCMYLTAKIDILVPYKC